MRYLLSVMAIILSAWMISTAHAADRDLDACENAKDANRQIAACTRLIESGRASASAYERRAIRDKDANTYIIEITM